VQPSIETLNNCADAAGWMKCSDSNSCFAVISFQRTSLYLLALLYDELDVGMEERRDAVDVMRLDRAEVVEDGVAR
jgi:hypothetical protein